MQGEAERGETPVPDLANLDAYYEVGAELFSAHEEFESDGVYRQRYRDKLAEIDDYAPLARDTRLWSEPTA
jgi:hypothetical protein